MVLIKLTFAFILIIFTSQVNLIYINPKLANNQYSELKKDYESGHNMVKREIMKDSYTSLKFPLYYFIFGFESHTNIKTALKLVEAATCITFKEQGEYKDGPQVILFQKNSLLCLSGVGLVSPKTGSTIYLTTDCYNDPLLITHEILHLLGLVHEHARKDRDEYVEVRQDYIKSYREINFNIRNYSFYRSYLTSYDYASLMHYNPYDFSTSSLTPVITAKLHPLYSKMMGQRVKMTFNDIKKVNLCHCNTCDWVDEATGVRKLEGYTNAECLNDGYPDPRDCKKCICPTGYTGNLCEKIMQSDESCGETTFDTPSEYRWLVFQGQKTCYIYITADENSKIEVRLEYYNAPYKDGHCVDEFGYEVKYLKDKGTTGLLLCGHNQVRSKLKPDSNKVLVIYKGNSGHSILVFSYKGVPK